MKKYYLNIVLLLAICSPSLAAGLFHGTNLRVGVSESKAIDQNATFLDFRWVWNINKLVEIGACYSVLQSELKTDFVDEISKNKMQYELNYGGLNFGIYPVYNENFTVRLGLSLAGGGYKWVPNNANEKTKMYGSVNIAVYEPSLEIAYFLNSHWQIDAVGSYKYVYENKNLSSVSFGIGVKYGIF